MPFEVKEVVETFFFCEAVGLNKMRSAALGWREAKRQLGLYLLSLNLEASEARQMLFEAAEEGDPQALEPLRQKLRLFRFRDKERGARLGARLMNVMRKHEKTA